MRHSSAPVACSASVHWATEGNGSVPSFSLCHRYQLRVSVRIDTVEARTGIWGYDYSVNSWGHISITLRRLSSPRALAHQDAWPEHGWGRLHGRCPRYPTGSYSTQYGTTSSCPSSARTTSSESACSATAASGYAVWSASRSKQNVPSTRSASTASRHSRLRYWSVCPGL
ncbi:hypothetical protein EDB85DRAFT_700306 [Lactarius pseudohatsudake]|nr:hypothetical protein EDB85DRAFT_700306 [Lactarius pseudohatsudake]